MISTDLRQTPEYTKYMKALGWYVASLNKDYLYIRKIPLLGNIGKLQRPHKFPTVKQLVFLKEKHRLSVLYIEPLPPPLPLPSHFRKAKSTFLPPKTIHIDLTESKKQLFNQLKSKTRYNVRLAKKRGVVIKNSTEIDVFANLWQSSARNRGMWIPQKKEVIALWDAFKERGDLLLAYKDKELLGGILLCNSRDTAHYVYAGSTKHGRQFFAPTLLVWEAIRVAKKRGKKIFDFEGVYDPRYSSTKTWKGFTKFKEGFGGEVINYPPTLVWYSNPLLKLLNI